MAAALVAIAAEDPPPRRFIAGADVIELAERKIAELRADIDSHRVFSESLTFEKLKDRRARWTVGLPIS